MKVSSLTIEMAANVARLQKDMEYARRTVDSAMGRISDSVGMATKALGFLGAGAGVSGLLNMARDVSYTAQEFERLAQLANTGTETMQAWSYGAKTAGVQQEKLSDILKDVNDKVGEFTQTGSGPLKDFFEQIAPKVGVTADQFARLGGPEALQLYATSLEKAGVSQQQATFYMEALASDSTALLPLLKNNGAAMNGLADEARNMGLVMSDQVVAQAVELARETDVLNAKLTGVKNTIASALIPVMAEMTSQMNEAEGGTRSFSQAVGSGLAEALGGAVIAGRSIALTFQLVGDTIGATMAALDRYNDWDFKGAKAVGDAWRAEWKQRLQEADEANRKLQLSTMPRSVVMTDEERRKRGLSSRSYTGLGRGSGEVSLPASADAERRAKEAARAAATELKAQQALYASLMGVSADYVEQLGRIQAMRLSGMVTDEQSIELATRLIEQQKVAGGIMEANAKWAEETAKANADAYEEQLNRVTGLEAELKAQRQANEAIGLSGVALAELEAARQRDAAAELERRSVVFDEAGNTAMSKLYEQQARALRELADARVAGATKQVAVEAAKKAEEAWKATTDQISQGLTDALMRGFEDGKGFGENFVDSLKNMFKTQLAKALQESIAQGLSSAFSGQGGGFNFGSLFGGGQGGVNWGSLAQRAWDWYSGGSAAAASSAYSLGTASGTGFGVSAAGTGYGVTATSASSGYGLSTVSSQWSSVAASASEAAVASESAAAASGTAASAWAAWAAVAVVTAGNLYKAGYTSQALGKAGSTPSHQLGMWSSTTGQSTGNSGVGDRSNNLIVNSSLHINSALSKLGFSDRWSEVLSGTVFAAHTFGRKLKHYGYQIDAAAGELGVRGFEFHKGGMLRSDKSVNFGIDSRDAEIVRQQFSALQDSVAATVAVLGGSREAVDSYTGSVRVNMEKATTAAEQNARMAESLEKFQGQLVEAAGISQASFQAVMEAVNASMEEVGVTAQSMGEIIRQGMTGQLEQAQVGEQLASVVLGGIYNTIASPFASQIASAFQAQIIQPIFTAIMAGVPVSQAISQQAVANVVATARNAASALNAIFADPAFVSTMRMVQEAISGISVAVGSVKVPKLKSISTNYSAASNAASDAAEAARRAAEEVKRQWTSITDTLLDEMRRLRDNILGDTSEQAESWYWSQFATLTAQARAGSQDAAEQLVSVSRALENIAANTAVSRAELNTTRASLMASLTATRAILGSQYGITLPAFAVGTESVPYDMVAKVHAGERITPAAYVGQQEALMAEVVAEVKGLRMQVAELQREAGRTADSTAAAALVLNESAQGRRALSVETA